MGSNHDVQEVKDSIAKLTKTLEKHADAGYMNKNDLGVYRELKEAKNCDTRHLEELKKKCRDVGVNKLISLKIRLAELSKQDSEKKAA